MAVTLSTVADYIAQSRVLLQDTVSPYRYPDADLVAGMNNAFDEVSRLRPDILLDATYQTATGPRTALGAPSVPSYSDSVQTAVVAIPTVYRLALVYFMAGWVQLRDSEETQDARASAFMNKFTTQLLQVMA